MPNHQPGPELDRLVAEAAGFRVLKQRGFEYVNAVGDGFEVRIGRISSGRQVGPGFWQPSVDANQALAVAALVFKAGWTVEYRPEEAPCSRYEFESRVETKASTLALAICLAIVKAVTPSPAGPRSA